MASSRMAGPWTALALLCLVLGGCAAPAATPVEGSPTPSALVRVEAAPVAAPVNGSGHTSPLHPVDVALHGAGGSVAYIRVVVPALPPNATAEYATTLKLTMAAGPAPGLLAWTGPGVVQDIMYQGQHTAYAFSQDQQAIVAVDAVTRQVNPTVAVGRFVAGGYDIWTRDIFWVIGGTRPWDATLTMVPGDMTLHDNGTKVTPGTKSTRPDIVRAAEGVVFTSVAWSASGVVSLGDSHVAQVKAAAPGWSHVTLETAPRFQSGDESAGNDRCDLTYADGTKASYGFSPVAGVPLLGVASIQADRIEDGAGVLRLECASEGLTHDRSVILTHLALPPGALEPGVSYAYD